MKPPMSATGTADRTETRILTRHGIKTLALALACQLALPATAGDTGQRNHSVTSSTANPARSSIAPRRFTFTGVFRFAKRRSSSPRVSLPGLTTGSLPPPPVKPNDPPTGSLGGPGPANAAVTAPAKSQLVIVRPTNPRDPGQATPNRDRPAANYPNRISRAAIAPANAARFSDPLPERTAPVVEAPTRADIPPAAMPVRQAHRPRKSKRRRRFERHHEGSGLPSRHPGWWRNAWNRDGPT